MPGKRLSSCCQELVSRLLVYFEQEKENRGPLLTVAAVHEVNCNYLLLIQRLHSTNCRELRMLWASQ